MAKKMFCEAGLERLRAPDKGRVEYGDSVAPGLKWNDKSLTCGPHPRLQLQ